jgi:hypothetical protein
LACDFVLAVGRAARFGYAGGWLGRLLSAFAE